MTLAVETCGSPLRSLRPANVGVGFKRLWLLASSTRHSQLRSLGRPALFCSVLGRGRMITLVLYSQSPPSPGHHHPRGALNSGHLAPSSYLYRHSLVLPVPHTLEHISRSGVRLTGACGVGKTIFGNRAFELFHNIEILFLIRSVHTLILKL
jgi:hypothetical protein